MAKFIFTGCGPHPISTSAIRWYDPCEGKLIIMYNNPSYDHSIKISAFGEIQWDTITGSTKTNCATGSDYVQPWNLSGFPNIFGATIDVWRAFRDGLWSSSLAITALCNGRSASNPANTNCSAGLDMPTTPGLISYQTTLSKPVSAYNASCVSDPLVSFTITVYEDGTFSIT